MNHDQRRRKVEDACAYLLAEGRPITFDAVAVRAGIGRATLYRHPELRATVQDRRTRGHDTQTVTDLAAEIAHLRTALNAIAASVRRHEEELRQLRGQHDAPDQPTPRASNPAPD
jgi:precorrin isomerase